MAYSVLAVSVITGRYKGFGTHAGLISLGRAPSFPNVVCHE